MFVQQRKIKSRLRNAFALEMSCAAWWYVSPSFADGTLRQARLIDTLISHKISLGDARSYFVTTARNDLGVVFATSEAGKSSSCCCESGIVTTLTVRAGATMEPVSWLEMRCPKTGRIEKRKCAKPSNL